MDINLPFWLFIAVAVSGAICLFDLFVYRKPRLVAINNVDDQFKHLDEGSKETDEAYKAAMNAAVEVPIPVEYAKSFFPVLALVFVLRSFLIEPFQIPSESMVPTLEVGDFIVVNKFIYGIRLPIIRTKVLNITDPKRGDVMVFFPPHESRYFIKRVVGLPGDVIKIRNHQLFINGVDSTQEFLSEDHRPCTASGLKYQLYHETFDDHTHNMRKCVIPGGLSQNGEWTVAEGHYFMMGDNRDNSLDSRSWGAVPEENIVGKAFAIWMHWNNFLSVPSFSRVGKL